MSDALGVTVELSAIMRGVKRIPNMAWILFSEEVPGANPGSGGALAAQASDLASGWVAGEDYEWLVSVTETPRGPVLWLEHPAELERLDDYLCELAARLSASGMRGSLHACPSQPPSLPSGRSVSAFVAYSLNGPVFSMPLGLDRQPPRPWQVDEDFTARMIDFAFRWAAVEDEELLLSLGATWMSVPVADAIDIACARVTSAHPIAAVSERAKPYRARWVTMSEAGRCAYGMHDDEVPWDQQVQHDTEALLFAPDRTDLGFLRSTARQPWWMMASAPNYGFPGGLEEIHVRISRAVWSSYTPDAHGVQLLTERHLDRAHDLSAWEITEIAKNRFLVRSRNLDLWYAHDLPNPEMLEQARHDFGGMLLTPEIANANDAW